MDNHDDLYAQYDYNGVDDDDEYYDDESDYYDYDEDGSGGSGGKTAPKRVCSFHCAWTFSFQSSVNSSVVRYPRYLDNITSTNIHLSYDVFLMGHISILIAMSVLLLRLLFSIIHCVVFLYF